MPIYRFDPQTRVLRVEAFVSGTVVKRVRMAVDTGASDTVLTPEALRDCGLDPATATRHSEVTTASQTEHAPMLTVSRFAALGHSVPNLEVACMSLPPALRLDGLLGLNFLRHFKLLVNFPRGLLVVQENPSHNFFQRIAQAIELIRAS